MDANASASPAAKEKFATTRVHRMLVIPHGSRKPEGVVSLVDICHLANPAWPRFAEEKDINLYIMGVELVLFNAIPLEFRCQASVLAACHGC